MRKLVIVSDFKTAKILFEFLIHQKINPIICLTINLLINRYFSQP